MTIYFDHEKLDVYQKSLEFIGWADELLGSLTNKPAVRDQLDRASTSVPLNIAEGNGKFSMKDRCRFLSIANGSALECAACLDVMVVKKMASLASVQEGKQRLKEVVSMLSGLQKSLMQRVAEESEGYCVGREEGEKE